MKVFYVLILLFCNFSVAGEGSACNDDLLKKYNNYLYYMYNLEKGNKFSEKLLSLWAIEDLIKRYRRLYPVDSEQEVFSSLIESIYGFSETLYSLRSVVAISINKEVVPMELIIKIEEKPNVHVFFNSSSNISGIMIKEGSGGIPYSKCFIEVGESYLR
ncbi:hypothetical protein [Pseudoalteromonas rubra]|uniref:hypothetical protein n=1 Tax=Pseudoalteromonas rubra TaxID=43658 RepID=UPI000F7A2240|nr:hypothetical protein [Pseudoalteromonas rubra]